MNKSETCLLTAAFFIQRLLLPTAVSCVLLNNALALQPPAEFTPKVAAGVVCQSWSPAEIQQLLKSISDEYQRSLNEFGFELQRSIQRRFSDRLQIPYAKGILIVSTPAGLDYWYCEEALGRDGARDLVEDFASQWRPEKEMKRPNYEVEISDVTLNSWSLSVNNLTWTPRLVETTEAEQKETGVRIRTTWEAQRRPGRSVWFRYQNGWLWSSYSDILLRAETLDLIPRLNISGRIPQGDLFAQAWLQPDQIPEQTRESFLSALMSVTGAESQQRDGESPREAHPRRIWNTCREVLTRTAFSDVDFVGIQAWTTADHLSLNAEIRARQDSSLSSFLSQTLPGQVESRSAADWERGIRFRLVSRIPESVLSLLSFDSDSEVLAPMDCVTQGIVAGDSLEQLDGHLEVQCRDPAGLWNLLTAVFPQIAHAEIRHPWLQNVPIQLASTVNPGDSLLRMDLHGPLSDRVANTEMAQRHARSGESGRTAVCEIEADAKTIESLAGHWLPEKDFSSGEQMQLERLSDLKARVEAGRDGAAFEFQFTKRFARRVCAALTLVR